MTIEDAWLSWMQTTRKTSFPPTVKDFEVIKRSSSWAAFEAGWRMAVAQEREACAKLADSLKDKTSQYADYVADVGDAIRSRA